MGKAINTTASWIGKAAYELIQSQGMNGRDANARAREMAEGLLDYGIELSRIDAREYASGGSDFAIRVAPVQISPDALARRNRQSAFLSQFR